jgi:3-hydroxyacyl-CoA dehydrogenase
MKRIAAIVGAGLIGRAWAMVFARAGWTVRMHDPVAGQVDAARAFMAQSLAEQVAFGLCTDAAAALARIVSAASLEEALADVEWVQENSPEVVDVKVGCSRSSIARRRPTPSSPVPRRRFRHRASPKVSPDARAAWSRIR